MPTEMLHILDKSTAEQIAVLFLKEFYATVTSNDFEKGHQSFYAKNAEFNLKSVKGVEKKADSLGVASVYAEHGFNKAFFDLSNGNIKVVSGVGNSLFITATGTIKRGNEKDEEVHNPFTQTFLLLPQKVEKSVAFFIVTEHMDMGADKVMKKPEPKQETPRKPAAKPAAKKPVEKKTEEPVEVEAPAPSKPFSYASALAQSSSPKQTPVAPPTSLPPRKSAPKPEAKESKPQYHSQVDENSVCVKKIPEGTTEAMLKEVFSKHGEIKSVVVKREIAFVEFESKDPAAKLLSLDPKERVETITVDGTEHRVELWRKTSAPRSAPRTLNPKH